MLKKLLIPVAFLAVLSPAYGLSEEQHESIPGEHERDFKKEVDYKIKSSSAFLKIARQIADAGNAEAISYLKRAEALAAEGQVHYNVGEFKFAEEDLSEATQMAIHAIIISRNKHDATIRDFAIQEEMLLKERQDRERKISMINKGLAEVEIFIKTSERLLSRDENPSARGQINEAKALYESSKGDLAAGKYDSALDRIDKAYTLATHSVKDIKRTQNDIITFPRPAFESEKDLMAYELKKNNSYIFFASQVLKGGAESNKDFDKGRDIRDEAIEAMNMGQGKKAIEKFRASTELLIRAIKGKP